MTKQEMLREIQRTARANGGLPLGRKTFELHTGIRYADWFGRFWKSWGDAVREAGLEPNTLNQRMGDDALLERYATLTRELGRVPVKGDLRLKRTEDPSFPSDKVFERFGAKAQLGVRVRDFCVSVGGFDDVLPLLPTNQPTVTESRPAEATTPDGYVYLLKSGRYYKFGRTNAVGRREREFAVQLPQDSRTVHSIKTDDPRGIEEYWHNRFADKRVRGEWFNLNAADLTAFKRRKFQ